MLYYEELFTRSQCSNCLSEISGLGIECAECQNGKLRLCSECFALGAEIGQHKPDHRYRFFDSGSLALFPGSANEGASTNGDGESESKKKRWSAREEIRLLDAIEQYGFGNWHDTSRHIETKSSIEAKKEFVERFVEGSVGQLSWSDLNNNQDQDDPSLEFKRNIGILPKPIDHTIPCDEGPLSPSLTRRLPPLDIGSEEMLQLGYMPFRDDYEKEYDNDAEKLVAQLSFTSEDDEVDVGLKLALVDMYSRRLRERARRKRVIRDYQLVSKFFKKDRVKTSVLGFSENNAPKEPIKRFQIYEKQLQEKLRPFAQFYNAREFDSLIKNVVKEKDLKFRLQELYKYRINGVTRPEDCIEFEKSKSGPGPGRGKRTAAAALMLGVVDEEDSNLDSEGRSYKKGMTPSPAPPILIQQLHQPSLMQGSPSPRISPLSVGGGGSNGAYASPSLTLQQFSRDDFSLRSSMESNGSELALLPQLLEGGMDQGALSQTLLEESSFQLNEKPKVSEGLFTANYIPGSDQLTDDELHLCTKAHLLPAQFLTIKLAFILGRLKPPGLAPADENEFECPSSMEDSEWDAVLQFLFNNYQSSQISVDVVS